MSMPIFGKTKIIGTEKERSESCFKEVKDICEKYDCGLVPVVNIIGGEIRSGIVCQAIKKGE